MSCLHTINLSPSSGILSICAPLLLPGDAVIFLEDGIYCCTVPDILSSLQPTISLYALKEDLIARGALEQCNSQVNPVDCTQFVSLCCDFEKVISWF